MNCSLILDVTSSSAGKKINLQSVSQEMVEEKPSCFCLQTQSQVLLISHAVTPINISGNVSTSSTSVNVPSSFEVSSVNERNKGILVEADENINLYGLSYSYLSGTADAYLALPCSKMAVDEYEYYRISYNPISSSLPSVISVK